MLLPRDVLCMGLTMFNASLLHYLPWGAGHVVGVLTPRANPSTKSQNWFKGSSHNVVYYIVVVLVGPSSRGWSILDLLGCIYSTLARGWSPLAHADSDILIRFVFEPMVRRPQDFMSFWTFRSRHATGRITNKEDRRKPKRVQGGGISIGLYVNDNNHR